jgi:hypothetical protein
MGSRGRTAQGRMTTSPCRLCTAPVRRHNALDHKARDRRSRPFEQPRKQRPHEIARYAAVVPSGGRFGASFVIAFR